MDDADQVALHGVQIDSPAQSRGESGHDCLGVVAGRVEPASTACCTRLRSGSNSAAMTSVATATATAP
ncbi:MAG: hypothetical protein ACLPKI_04740 [Streptosporangiaceae bacterium]